MSARKEIRSPEKKQDYLGYMVRFINQAGSSPISWAEKLRHFLIDMPVIWTAFTDFNLDYRWADCYKSTYGDWGHTGNYHNELGMAYAWLGKNEFDYFNLSDSPDFWGTIEGKNIAGDIGKCSPVAILQGLEGLNNLHCLWISVLNYNTQIVLEFFYNPAAYIGYNKEYLLEFKFDRQKALKDVFWCDDCQMWTITKKSRDTFWKPQKENNKRAQQPLQLSLDIAPPSR